jgi:hypothetical protein
MLTLLMFRWVPTGNGGKASKTRFESARWFCIIYLSLIVSGQAVGIYFRVQEFPITDFIPIVLLTSWTVFLNFDFMRGYSGETSGKTK